MRKLYLYLLASAILSLVILGWLIDSFSQTTLEVEDRFAWESKIAAGVAAHVSTLPNTLRAKTAATLANEFDIDIRLKEGTTLALPKELKTAMLDPEGLILEDQAGFYLLKSTPDLLPDYLEFRLDKVEDTSERSDMALTLLFYSGVCLFMWFILSPLAKRLTALTNVAKRFASGDLSARIEVNHFTYIKDVELTFNRMANQIEKLLAENKLMASSLSHDIRTPVACLRFGVDAAQDAESLDEAQSYLTRMENDLDQMEAMLKSYLSFATLEQKAQALNFEETALRPYLTSLADQLMPKAKDRNVQIKVSCPVNFPIVADLHWLARAIGNLISNACDFAKEHILLSAFIKDNQIFITVEDDGQGIAKENWAQVFKPFYREQTHRNREGQSYGLGLAIVAKVADWHHGDVSVGQSDELLGAKFVFSFPLKPVRKL
ncbi:ATP-binding protein [Pseudoalteromonas xiamenensis]|uniref:ATP-binding protein n=1 Tax=Pseudoalteromonas xiamenensis TaxID=882626 RepID=UPI0027E5BC6D|nr:ATP-binding protein [Pseudoalteromonas xiamenensis]WMN59715.1 ATP-binding protein [Pseudoalteromonas xiamenensis]